MPLRAEEGQYGSGTVAGGDFGNKAKPDITQDGDDNENLRFGTSQNTDPYSGMHPKHGSGSTAGAGFGNKTSNGFGGAADSKVGKLMEKLGGMLGNEKMVEKGRVRHESKGFAQEDEADELHAEGKAPV